MRWENRGHIYDHIGGKFRGIKRFYIYGCGVIGKRLFNNVSNTGGLAGFIDNKLSKVQKEYHGIPIFSHEEMVKEKELWDYIIIAAEGAGRDEIIKLCEKDGWTLGVNLFMYEEVENHLEVFYAYGFEKIFLKELSLSLTDKCTLKCKECALSFPYLKEKGDRPITEIISDLNLLFEKVSYISYFEVLGGEPFLYSDLVSVMRYISEHFRSRIGKLQITTNATLSPGQEVLEQLKELDISIYISDYNQINKLKDNAQRFSKELDKYGINYIIDSGMEWVDFGFNKKNINKSEEDAENTMDICSIQCMTIRNKYLYYCFPAFMAERVFYIGEDDSENYVDLNHLPYNTVEFMEWTLGHRQSGSLEMCKHCNGQNGKAKIRVIPGEQM